MVPSLLSENNLILIFLVPGSILHMTFPPIRVIFCSSPKHRRPTYWKKRTNAIPAHHDQLNLSARLLSKPF